MPKKILKLTPEEAANLIKKGLGLPSTATVEWKLASKTAFLPLLDGKLNEVVVIENENEVV